MFEVEIEFKGKVNRAKLKKILEAIPNECVLVNEEMPSIEVPLLTVHSIDKHHEFTTYIAQRYQDQFVTSKELWEVFQGMYVKESKKMTLIKFSRMLREQGIISKSVAKRFGRDTVKVVKVLVNPS